MGELTSRIYKINNNSRDLPELINTLAGLDWHIVNSMDASLRVYSRGEDMEPEEFMSIKPAGSSIVCNYINGDPIDPLEFLVKEEVITEDGWELELMSNYRTLQLKKVGSCESMTVTSRSDGELSLYSHSDSNTHTLLDEYSSGVSKSYEDSDRADLTLYDIVGRSFSFE